MGPESERLDWRNPRRKAPILRMGYSRILYIPSTNMEYRPILDENRDIKAPDNFDKICRERPNHPVLMYLGMRHQYIANGLELYYLRRLNGRRHLEG